ncbi:MAG TPA: hypothetical protein PK156_43935 [Polyangium sp.]|nr:hypothetical protein [Polyangium sp.]
MSTLPIFNWSFLQATWGSSGLFRLGCATQKVVDLQYRGSIVMTMDMKPIAEVDMDPVLDAVHGAPIVEATVEEMAAFEEGLADIRAGRTRTAAQVRRGIDARTTQ